MLNIVIPMAGKGSRFANAGYTIPKPLIDIHGVPMIKVVIDNLTPKMEHRFIFICQNQHILKYNLNEKLCSYTKNPIVIGIDKVTDGQACSVIKAKDYIDNDDYLMTANSDQYIDTSIDSFLDFFIDKGSDGTIMTMKSTDPKWSYIKIDSNNNVIETAEKQVISNEATVGIYCFRKGSDFVSVTEQMIKDNNRVNNEFYICPAYNYLIRENKTINYYSIGEEANGMYGLGVPEDLELFKSLEISRQVVK